MNDMFQEMPHKKVSIKAYYDNNLSYGEPFKNNLARKIAEPTKVIEHFDPAVNK